MELNFKAIKETVVNYAQHCRHNIETMENPDRVKIIAKIAIIVFATYFAAGVVAGFAAGAITVPYLVGGGQSKRSPKMTADNAVGYIWDYSRPGQMIQILYCTPEDKTAQSGPGQKSAQPDATSKSTVPGGERQLAADKRSNSATNAQQILDQASDMTSKALEQANQQASQALDQANENVRKMPPRMTTELYTITALNALGVFLVSGLRGGAVAGLATFAVLTFGKQPERSDLMSREQAIALLGKLGKDQTIKLLIYPEGVTQKTARTELGQDSKQQAAETKTTT